VGVKTVKAFTVAVQQRLDRNRGRLPDSAGMLMLSEGLTGFALSVSGEVQYGEAERAFMVGERVVHDGVA
jgi:hypothetical protein